eukprot:12596283-Alexandrium_andersonii.AAC.1
MDRRERKRRGPPLLNELFAAAGERDCNPQARVPLPFNTARASEAPALECSSADCARLGARWPTPPSVDKRVPTSIGSRS